MVHNVYVLHTHPPNTPLGYPPTHTIPLQQPGKGPPPPLSHSSRGLRHHKPVPLCIIPHHLCMPLPPQHVLFCVDQRKVNTRKMRFCDGQWVAAVTLVDTHAFSNVLICEEGSIGGESNGGMRGLLASDVWLCMHEHCALGGCEGCEDVRVCVGMCANSLQKMLWYQ